MPTNNGNYTLPPIYKAEPGTTILSAQHNVPLEDLAVAMNGTIMRDGTRGPTANLPMGGKKITGLGAATNPSDAVRFDQVPPGITGWLLSVSQLSLAANQIPYATGSATAAVTGLSAFGRSLIDDADAAAARTTLGLGAMATKANVAISDISATGSASSATFLRGDGTWQSPPSVTPTDIQFSQLGSWFVTAGAVGTYVLATRTTGNIDVAFGSTLAGSSLSVTGALYKVEGGVDADTGTGSTLSGTWRAMSIYDASPGGNSRCAALWIRIS